MRKILPVLILVLFATLIATGCGQYGKKFSGDAAGGGEEIVTEKPFDAAAKKKYGCTDVEEFESEVNEHVDDEKIEYEQNPPVAGNHNPQPADWGIYDKKQRDVNTVHSLEHGHIVIAHKGLSSSEEDKLISYVERAPFHLLVQPRADNPKDGVYYTAWKVQMYCEKPGPEALQFMIDNHLDQGPELFADDPSHTPSNQ